MDAAIAELSGLRASLFGTSVIARRALVFAAARDELDRHVPTALSHCPQRSAVSMDRP